MKRKWNLLMSIFQLIWNRWYEKLLFHWNFRALSKPFSTTEVFFYAFDWNIWGFRWDFENQFYCSNIFLSIKKNRYANSEIIISTMRFAHRNDHYFKTAPFFFPPWNKKYEKYKWENSSNAYNTHNNISIDISIFAISLSLSLPFPIYLLLICFI